MKTLVLFLAALLSICASAQELTKEEVVHAITRGAGLLPGQTAEPSAEESAFRAQIERRKDTLLAERAPVEHPALLSPEDFGNAQANLRQFDWARSLYESNVAMADYALAQPPGWIESMIPELTPGHSYGVTCPRCVGDKSQEAAGGGLLRWSYREPEKLTCESCGQVYPDPAYPETATLRMPRMGQEFSYYLNEQERAQPENRSGALAYHWVGYPVHVSFSGVIREHKIGFMRSVAKSAALAYAFAQKPEYAKLTRDILLRYAQCYRNWLYHDYWDTIADCDPMYAAWHDKALPLAWKRHLTEQAYKKDSLDKASMLQTYWGAGRTHPSTDAISGLGDLALAYDLTCNALDEPKVALWSAEQRAVVERDLLLEWIMGAEPYLGGEGKADREDNKAPRLYRAMAEVAKVLGIPLYADVALRGYERVRDESFLFDGFSTESPSYTNMYLDELVMIPDVLHGFAWPENGLGRSGVVDYFGTDQKLAHMFRALIWTLLPDGTFVPLGDTHAGQKPSLHIVQIGQRHYSQLFGAMQSQFYASPASEYAWLHMPPESLASQVQPLALPETLAPGWGTAILREGEGATSSTATLAFNPEGGHRHRDNLSLFYWHRGKTPLGDLGYVGDMPVNNWIKSTFSHNLVIVDDQEQQFKDRAPQFDLMATSPLVSVVEASAKVYAIEDYRRRVALVKLDGGHSFLVDLFHVRGGKKHAFRVYSEHAASDTSNGRLEFEGVAMPEEPPLPQVGASLAKEDIFGPRDVRSAVPNAETWRATWRDDQGAYRLWLLSQCDRVEASNGPGQRSLEEQGRRVRVVDAIREGDAVESTFVVLHEPSLPDGTFAIEAAEQLATAGGTVLRVRASGQTFLILNNVQDEAVFESVSFAGRFAVVNLEQGRYCAVGAEHLFIAGKEINTGLPLLRSKASTSGISTVSLPEAPAQWPPLQAQGYVRAKTAVGWIGLAIANVEAQSIVFRDYPAPEVEEVEMLNVCYSG